jgi:hypothetical protein
MGLRQRAAILPDYAVQIQLDSISAELDVLYVAAGSVNVYLNSRVHLQPWRTLPASERPSKVNVELQLSFVEERVAI